MARRRHDGAARQRITVVGAGYVGLANALLLARQHEVTLLDTDAAKVARLQRRECPLADAQMAAELAERSLHLVATTDADAAYAHADWVVLALPTDAAAQGAGGCGAALDTQVLQQAAAQALQRCPQAVVVVKSTVPLGFVAALRSRLGSERIVYVPEFLREGRALHDCRYPSRIVVGERGACGQAAARLFAAAALDSRVPVLLTPPAEAEAIKLFSNAYLALRVAFFNELDSLALTRALDTRAIIEGLALDERIGGHYCNPSFGYGGYCLPKDARQLLAEFDGVPQALATALVAANGVRARLVLADILRRRPKVVGIYRLTMKAGADNFRDSASVALLRALQARGVQVLVYEPLCSAPGYLGAPVLRELAQFKARAELIVANRNHAELRDVAAKVYTRDVFGTDA